MLLQLLFLLFLSLSHTKGQGNPFVCTCTSTYQSFICPDGQPLALTPCAFDFSKGQCQQTILGCPLNTTLANGEIITQYSNPCPNCGPAPSNSSVHCPDGKSGYAPNCELLENGNCGYQFIPCPTQYSSTALEMNITCQQSDCGDKPQQTSYLCFDGTKGGLIGCLFDNSLNRCNWQINDCLPFENPTGSVIKPNTNPKSGAQKIRVDLISSAILVAALVIL